MGKLLIAIVCLIDFVVLPILMFTSAAQSHSATGYVYGVNCFLYFCAVFKMIIVFFVIVVKTASYVYDSKMDELVEAAYWMYFIFWVVWTFRVSVLVTFKRVSIVVLCSSCHRLLAYIAIGCAAYWLAVSWIALVSWFSSMKSTHWCSRSQLRLRCMSLNDLASFI